MNADTKKKIEEQARWHVHGVWGKVDAEIAEKHGFECGAEFGYQLARKDAEVLVDAMVDIRSECTMPNPTSTPEYVISRVCEALEQWKKVIE